MGDLINKRIIQTRNWVDPNPSPIPTYDYDFVYPITVYEAVKRSMDDNSPNLSDELNSIYRLIADKQDIIQGGTPGQLMIWSGIQGQIGAIDVAKAINPDPAARSHQKIATERAVGDALDNKASLSALGSHTNDNSIHLTDIERGRWNSMAPLNSLQSHVANVIMHITNDERARWNSKAAATDVDAHVYNTNNPHNVTAHQVGTYTRKEVDDMFTTLRESFFNYLNISWDDRTNVAKLVEYHPVNWNPNYVLEFGKPLPDVTDPTQIYFALIPATDYKINETADCIIYIKRPGLAWQEVGSTTMNAGDLVIKYPETSMFAWMQGRFLRIFNESTPDIDPDDGLNGNVWKPTIDGNGLVTWALSKDTTAPSSINIKGQDGYNPIKGIDYEDGKDGEGVPVGGMAGDLLIKLSNENFDTNWKSLIDVFNDLALSGSYLPADVVVWDNIKGKPNKYNELGPNDDGYITQKAATRQFDIINTQIAEVVTKVDGPTGIEGIKNDLYDHTNDFNNPHRTTPAQIGAVSTATYTDHVQNLNNPHNVTKAQIGLDKVDNTTDVNKPISNATQIALDLIKTKLDTVTDNVAASKYITNVKWDNPTNTLEFEFKDSSTLSVIIPIVDTFSKIRFDNATRELVIELPDGTENRINISALIQTYYGSIGANVQVIIDNDNIVKASIIPGSIGQYEIMPSVHLRNSPTTTTQPVSDRSGKIATTEFVGGQVINNLISYETDRPLSANMGRLINQSKADIDDVIQIINDLEGIDVVDNLDSTNPLSALSANMGRYLDLIKAPRVHTSPSGSTFGRATISLFGHTRAAEIDPLMDGTVFRGTDDGRYSRGDHRHPTDITRAPLHSPDLTGEPKAAIPPDASNDSRIPTTEWVRRNIPGVMWGTSVTASDVTTKIVTLKSSHIETPVFMRQIGSTVVVKFKNGDDNTGITQLDVHGSGPAPVHFESRPISPHMIGKDRDHMFTYDGAVWELLNPSTGTELYGGFSTGPVNQMTEFLGFTVEGHGGTVNADGDVDRLLITIPYKDIKPQGSKVTISNNALDWAARMGDNQLINLKDPLVLFSSRSHAVIQFTMVSRYPSNSPCGLVFRRPQASIKIESDGGAILFVPVANITGVPSSINVGGTLRLTSIAPNPTNATNQAILWSINSAGTTGATISNGVLSVSSAGTLTLRATVDNGQSETVDYVQDFTITAVAATINITGHPMLYQEVLYGNISETLSVYASVSSGVLSYQWYTNTINSYTGAVQVTGATSNVLSIPANLDTGDRYFFCNVSATGGATPVNTSIAAVRVISKVYGVSISPKPATILQFGTMQLIASVLPANATDKSIIWSSSNPSVLSVSGSGIITANLAGSAIVSATTVDGGIVDSFSITVSQFVSVTDISNTPTTAKSGTALTLSGTVAPVAAINKTITWNIIDANGTASSITGNVLTPDNSGENPVPITVRAMIANGISPNVPFVKDFMISVQPDYISVKDMMLTSVETRAKVPMTLTGVVSPSNATNKTIVWSIANDGGTGSSITNGVLTGNNVGTVKVRATIVNGATRTTNFVKDFDVSIISEFIPAIDITGAPTRIFKNIRTDSIDGSCVPSNATYRSVTWVITDTGTTGATLNVEDEDILATNTGVFTLKGIVVNGTAIGTNFEKLFTVNVVDFIPVTDLNDVPASFRLDKSIQLTGSVFPANTSFKDINWTILNGGGTGAVITNGNTLSATAPGTVKVRATIVNGVGAIAEGTNNNYIQDFDIVVLPKFVPVTNVETNIPNLTMKVEDFITLTGTVTPSTSTNKAIVWTISDAGTTGATLDGNTLTAAAVGTVKLRATIAKGSSDTTEYIQEFDVRVAPISVTDITSVPATFRVDQTLQLTGTIAPTNATNKNINWSVVSAGVTGASITGGNALKATGVGTVTVRATITNGVDVGTSYTKDFTIVVTPVPVTDITGIPATMEIATPITLTGVVAPANATYNTIVWSVVNANGTGAAINGGILSATTAGTVTIKATIAKGTNETTAYSKDFNVVVLPIAVTNITDIPTTMSVDTPVTLTGTVVPANASRKTITWSVVDAGTTGASIDAGVLTATAAGTVTVNATITNGINDTTNYTQDFVLTVS